MTSLPFASAPFLAIQVGTYLLFTICVVVAWKHARTLFGLMIGSVFLGYAVEFSQTTTTPPPYNYTQAIVTLPGQVPLGIVLSWGMILFAIWHALSAFDFGWLRHSLAGGLMAVTLDFVTDPAFVYLDFWVWNLPTQYFGIPFSNFVGWFVIVATFFASLRGVFHFFPPEKRSPIVVALCSIAAIIPAFLGFVGIMLVYEGLLKLSPAVLTEPRVVALYLVPAGIYVALGVARRSMGAGSPAFRSAVDRLTVIVPGYLLGLSAIIFLSSAMQGTYPQQAIIYPVLFLVVIGSFYWPLTRR